MEVMTIDEAIKHAEEVAIQRENDALAWEKAKPSYHADEALCEENADSCRKCAAEYRQLVVWLKDYKRLLERESCEDAVSRQDVLDLCDSKDPEYKTFHLKEDVECLPTVNKLGWVSVRERLPEEETDVLICNRNGDIAISMGSYSTEVENDFIWYTSGWRFGKVIAWMPLPEPCKVEMESEEV